MLASVGVSEEQVFGDLYLAWLKDTGEKNTSDSRKLFRDVVEKGFGDRSLILRKERLGANVAASLAALLHRGPITCLDLHGNTLRDTGCEMLSLLVRDLPNLTYLDFGANDIGPLGMQSLSFVVAGHKRLQTLILGSSARDAYANRVNAASATMLLEGCLRSRTLRHLDLSGSALGERSVEKGGMDVSPPRGGATGRLNFAAARRNQFGVAPAALTGPNSQSGNANQKNENTAGGGGAALLGEHAPAMKPIDLLEELIVNSTSLVTLKLREAQLSTAAALRIVKAATRSGSLAYLDLSGNGFSGAVGNALGDLVRGRSLSHNFSALCTILLNNNPLMRPDSDVPPPRIFSSLAADRIVTCLHLDSCGIDDKAMIPLCRALETNGALQSLHLRHNAITHVGAVELARTLHRHTFLQDVSMEGNILKDEGVCAFASMLETNATLLSLNIAHTWMGERGIVALGVSLGDNKALQRLNIADNHVTEDAGEAFAALLESNRSLLRCNMYGNGVGHHTVLRVERSTERNRLAHQNLEKDDLEKEVVRLHYQMYKLDEARTELDQLQQKKIEIGRAADAFEVQFKQEQISCAKRERELTDKIDNYLMQEEHCHNEKKRLDLELERAKESFVEESEIAKQRYEEEVAVREAAEEEHRVLKAQLDDIQNNGPQREAAKRQYIDEVNEDRKKWAAQSKEYRQLLIEKKAALNELQTLRGDDGPKKKKGKSKK